MPLQMEAIIALRLQDELAEWVEQFEELPPREAVAGLRKTLFERCLLLRSLLPAAERHEMRSQVLNLLKRDQRILASAREYRETGIPTLQ